MKSKLLRRQGYSGDGSHVSVPTVPSRQSINGDGPSRYEIRIRKNGNHTAGADRYRRSSARPDTFELFMDTAALAAEKLGAGWGAHAGQGLLVHQCERGHETVGLRRIDKINGIVRQAIRGDVQAQGAPVFVRLQAVPFARAARLHDEVDPVDGPVRHLDAVLRPCRDLFREPHGRDVVQVVGAQAVFALQVRSAHVQHDRPLRRLRLCRPGRQSRQPKKREQAEYPGQDAQWAKRTRRVRAGRSFRA